MEIEKVVNKWFTVPYINFVHERQYIKFVVGSFVCSTKPLDSKYRFVTIKLYRNIQNSQKIFEYQK